MKTEIFELNHSNIKNLSLKLEGKLPVDRDELLALANTWGRNTWFPILTKNGDSEIKNILSCKPKEKYDLSKLDVSKIKNFDSIFAFSNFEGNISLWDVSRATSMSFMFTYTTKFNSPLDKWDTSNVTSMYGIFQGSKMFNQDLNFLNLSKIKTISYMFHETRAFNKPVLWDISKIEHCNFMFDNAKAFEKKFNKRKSLPFDTSNIELWLKENKSKMVAIDIKDNKAKDLNKFILDISLQNKSFIERLFINSKFLLKGNL